MIRVLPAYRTIYLLFFVGMIGPHSLLASEKSLPVRATGDITFAVDTYSFRGDAGVAYEEIAIRIPTKQLPFERVGEVYVATYSPRLQLFDVSGREVKKVEGVRRVTLPSQAIIRIFTLNGNLVTRLDHTSGSGDEEWEIMANDNNQFIVSGVYVAHITDPASGDTDIEKFVIVR